MLNQNLLKTVLVGAVFFTMSSCGVQKTIYTEPQEAKIYVNSNEVATGSYKYKFARGEDFINLRFESPGYITRDMKLMRNNPKRTVSYKMYEDAALKNSTSSELANTNFTVTAKKGMSEREVWQRLMNISISNFQNIAVKDEAAGWIRTAWIMHSFDNQVIRTRLEVQKQFAGDGVFAYRAKLSSEIADRECGNSDECFAAYSRVLKTYSSVISELQTTVGSNF